jgi:hypothetical protein
MSLCYTYQFIFSVVQQPNMGLGHLIVEVSKPHTIRHTHTGTIPVNKWWTHCRGHYLHNAQQTQMNIHASSGIRTYDHSNQVAEDLSL